MNFVLLFSGSNWNAGELRGILGKVQGNEVVGLDWGSIESVYDFSALEQRPHAWIEVTSFEQLAIMEAKQTEHIAEPNRPWGKYYPMAA